MCSATRPDSGDFVARDAAGVWKREGTRRRFDGAYVAGSRQGHPERRLERR